MLKIGSLCTGYGGLDMAVEAYYEAETIWVSDVGLSRAQTLKILGNGVVPQQAYRALELLNNVK